MTGGAVHRRPPGRGQSGTLVGRSAELDRIAALLADPTGGSLVLRGDPGVGKTALLDIAVGMAQAAGRRVLRAAGVEYEAELAFSGLHQVLHPISDGFERLPSVQQQALDQAFAVVEGSPPNRLAISVAALAALEGAAHDQPVLIAIDDFQWIDASSAEVLLFIARRIAALPIAVLASTRRSGDGLGLPQFEVDVLSDELAEQLLRSKAPALASAPMKRILSEAAGNPLALLELPAALEERQLTGLDPLPESLPLSTRVEGLFADRIRDLPSATRFLLLIAAVGTDSLATVLAAADQSDLDVLSPAVVANLVHVEEQRVRFRHPLVRSSIFQMALPSQRRLAHQSLAAALADLPERRAWHLAAAAVGPDKEVAAAVEEAARTATRRGGAAVAVASLIRAAELSPDPVARARRLGEAAFLANQTGQFGRARALLAEAGRVSDVAPSTYAATTAAFLMLDRDGDLHGARRVLMNALEQATPGDSGDDSIANTLYLLLVTAYLASEPGPWTDFDAVLSRLAGTPGTEMFSLYRDAMADPARSGHGLRERLLAVVEALPDDVEPWFVTRLGSVCAHIDAYDVGRERLRRLVERERDDGAQDSLMIALSLLSHDAYNTGRWNESEALANEGLALVDGGGSRIIAGNLHYRLALLAASRGQIERSLELSDELLSWNAAHAVKQWEFTAWHCRTVAAAAQGDFASAYACASRISPAGELASHVPLAPWLVFDLVEAAVRIGRIDEARAHVVAAQAADIGRVSARMGVLAAGAAAIAAAPGDAGELFEAALSLPRIQDWPFEQARIRLAHGEWLRRSRAGTRAVAALQLANEDFDRLGARPWAVRASNELRAMGVNLGARATKGYVALTPQELEIAQLAARGLSNKAIGQRMYLSPRTVGSHLYRLFPKLGITSRSALRDALVAHQEHQPGT
ncbi:MAG: AAA family ATPase [Ilumatobacteraceae bacterium]